VEVPVNGEAEACGEAAAKDGLLRYREGSSRLFELSLRYLHEGRRHQEGTGHQEGQANQYGACD
jgi:hypothetical protein